MKLKLNELLRSTPEWKVAGLMAALEAGDIRKLVNNGFDWVSSDCFTTQAWATYLEARDRAWESYEETLEAKDQDWDAYLKKVSMDLKAYREAKARAFLELASKEENWL